MLDNQLLIAFNIYDFNTFCCMIFAKCIVYGGTFDIRGHYTPIVSKFGQRGTTDFGNAALKLF